jgi:hypothetical protein
MKKTWRWSSKVSLKTFIPPPPKKNVSLHSALCFWMVRKQSDCLLSHSRILRETCQKLNRKNSYVIMITYGNMQILGNKKKYVRHSLLFWTKYCPRQAVKYIWIINTLNLASCRVPQKFQDCWIDVEIFFSTFCQRTNLAGIWQHLWTLYTGR